MNRTIITFYFFFFLFSLQAFVYAMNEEIFIVSPESAFIVKGGETVVINVYSTSIWQISNQNNEWLTIKKIGDSAIEIQVTNNKTEKTRNTEVALKDSSGQVRTIAITQYATDFSVGQLEVSEWLESNSAIAKSLIWINKNKPIVYADWTPAMKEDLQHAVTVLQNGGTPFSLTGLPTVDVFQYNHPQGFQLSLTKISDEDAWQYYVSTIAQSILTDYSEIVNWKLSEISFYGLSVLFDSRQLLVYDDEHGSYNFNFVTPSAPDFAIKFLENHALIGPTPKETIIRILEWSKSMSHFTGGMSIESFRRHWQYDGPPPVNRILIGTVSSNNQDLNHYINGCHGNVQFLYHLLKIINIPVAYIFGDGHAQPHFIEEDLFLAHADDPYTAYVKYNNERVPAGELLISSQEREALFGEHLSFEQRWSNVGSVTARLGVEYKAYHLLNLRCTALAKGLSDKETYELMHIDDHYTFERLEEMNFFKELDAKIEQLKFCDEPGYQGIKILDAIKPKPFDGNNIEGLTFHGMLGEAIINNIQRTIIAYTESDLDRTQIVPHFRLSEMAQIDIPSGMALDFTTPQTVNIRAQNGDMAQWTVILKNESPKLLVEPKFKSVQGTANGMDYYYVSSDLEWSVESNEDWISVEKLNNSTFGVWYVENPTGEDRKATITIGNKNEKVSVVFKQIGSFKHRKIPIKGRK